MPKAKVKYIAELINYLSTYIELEFFCPYTDIYQQLFTGMATSYPHAGCKIVRT